MAETWLGAASHRAVSFEGNTASLNPRGLRKARQRIFSSFVGRAVSVATVD